MHDKKDQCEVLINRLLDAELSPEAEHELNLELIRDPELMRLRDDYHGIDALAADALSPVRKGEVDFSAVFAADRSPIRFTHRMRRGWIAIPGAIAAALLAMVIPGPDFRGQPTDAPIVVDPRSLYSVDPNGGWNGESVNRPVSETAPRIRSKTGRDVIGVVGDDGNLYWIEVEKKRTEHWPAGRSLPDPKNSF